MKVQVGPRTYQMNDSEYRGLLKIASEQVPFGVYAVEKKGYAEVRHDHCKSITQLKTLKRQYRAQGFKVHANGGD